MAILAQELLAACTVFAILDHICAIAFRTVKDYCFADHLPFIPSFRKYHYQNIFGVISLEENSEPMIAAGMLDIPIIKKSRGRPINEAINNPG